MLPALGDNLQLGTGGYTTIASLVTLEGEDEDEATAEGAVFLDLAPGTDEDALLATFRDTACEDDLICELFEVPIDTPSDIVNFGRVRTTPLILGGLLALLAAATLANVLVSSVHLRGRELATLKVLGYTRRQVSAAVAGQATALVVVALVVAVPLGVAAGSALWQVRARDLGIVEVASIPGLQLALVIVLAVTLANVLAAIPGRSAAHARPAHPPF